MAIFEFSLEVTDAQTVLMPGLATILCVQTQGGVPCLWALVNPDDELRPRKIMTYGTGQTIGNPGMYIGTYQLPGLVFHVFEDMGTP